MGTAIYRSILLIFGYFFILLHEINRIHKIVKLNLSCINTQDDPNLFVIKYITISITIQKFAYTKIYHNSDTDFFRLLLISFRYGT